MSKNFDSTGAVTQQWFKATQSSSTNCVEIAFTSEATLIRDSKYLRDPANDPAQQPVLRVAATQWSTFLDAVRNRATAGVAGLPRIDYHTTGGASLFDGITTLTYTAGEWEAFATGILAGEFERATTSI